MRRLLWVLAAPALLAFPLPVMAGYVVTDLGNPGSYGSFTALNDSGQVVGYSDIYQQGSDIFHALLYSGGTTTDLGTFGGIRGQVYGINNAGQIAGYTLTGPGNGQAILYSGGQATGLGNLGGTFSIASGINAAGQVVGYAALANGLDHAFLYSGGKMQDLGTLSGSSSVANALNASGQVVGASALPDGSWHAFLYSGGKMQDLGSLGGGNSDASAINASGQIVGGSLTASGQSHAFLYRGGKMTDLGTLGGSWSSALGINDAGQVVGGSGGRAFLYSGGKMTDLNWLLDQAPPATLTTAVAINNHGQILATGSDGHGYLLTPDGVSAAPEPSGLVLLALGGAGLFGSACVQRRAARSLSPEGCR
jgi:probable HAF family extracellular repeat protein